MNKNKKLVSFVCAIAMIITMLSSFTFVSAAEEGFTLSTPVVSSDGKTITFDVGYTNITSGISSGRFKINMPEEVTAVAADPAPQAGGLSNGVYTYPFALGQAATSETSGTITKLTLTLSDALATAKNITIEEGSYLETNDNSTYEVGDDTNSLAAPTVELPQDPNAPTPKPVTTTTPKPVATAKPAATDKPAIDDPVKSTKGFVFGEPTVSEDGLKVTVDVNYVGVESGISSGRFKIDMPAEVTEVAANPAPQAGGLSGGVYTYPFALGQTATSETSGTIATLTLTLKTPFKYDNQLTIKTGSYLETNNNATLEVGSDDVLASNVVLPAFGGTEPTPDVKGSIELKKAVTVKVSDTPAEGVSQYFIIPVVKNADGSNAKYEDDFVTNYNGTKLTEDQYDNLLNGYFTADNVKDLGVTSMEDVVNGLSYSLYNSNITVAAQLVNRATGEIQNGNDTEQSLTPAKPTAKPSEPSISVKASSTTVEFDKKFTVTATVKNAKDGAKVAFTTNDDEKYAVIFGTPTEINSKGETKATYVANDKPGTVTITATYKDTEGNEKSASVKVTVKKASTTTGGNDGTTSGGGPGIIAPGNTGALTTPNTNTNYKPDFQDLDSVEWARTAINGLAMRGMINGRDQYTFDPNANITRAEYCQILMGAINALNAKGESTFADVPSTAWYYNAVSVASQLGIVSGYGDGNFGPNDLITRQDMALMTYKTAQIMNKSLEPVNAEITFEDSHEIADYAFEAVMTLQKAGIINGMTDTTFEPHSNATRAQSAKVIFDTFVDAQ